MTKLRLPNRIRSIFVAALLIPMANQAQDGQLTMKDLAGSWSGKLKIQSTQLRLDMNISFNGADSLIVTFDSPDQGILDLPTDKVTLTEDSLVVSLKAIGGEFGGKINKDANSIAGSWKQGGMAFPLVMERQGKQFTINRPQEPKPPFPYRSEEVVFTNVEGGFELAGTLTLPEAVGCYPAAILITGSGPQNRDEELLGHKPFLVLADYLTRQGFAVLRYDDRGVAQSKGDFKTATSLDFAKDAESALDFLKKHSEIDTSKIGLIGHSEGGLISSVVASHRKDIAFTVLMAGTGLPGEQILLLQSALISRAVGVNEATIKSNEKLSRDIYSALKKNQDNAKAGQKIRNLMADFNKKNAKDTSYHPVSETVINAQIESLTSPWFRSFLTLNPEKYLSEVSCPLLAINGSLDLQVPSKENLQAIEKALIFGGNSNYVVEELPGLNHLFQTATTGSPTEYAKIEETISPIALDLIGKWLEKNVEK
ncbi:MAG: acyl-CoA thioester hydrolase/BAAT C-terminal domain-containing protein [Bacteroidales bacterium]|nr:acyl-CoA thioester hydrolase/BAAT C-terminal domain-containing protein [Bacteroidales bacterium]